jgi:hypothetical protein
MTNFQPQLLQPNTRVEARFGGTNVWVEVCWVENGLHKVYSRNQGARTPMILSALHAILAGYDASRINVGFGD